nr:hypothetical protein GCM10020063_069480 [Dactylosporangium thailandense]
MQAAGNNGDDACYYSPQGVAAALTVGNSTSADARNSSSTYGSCLDLFAPGTSIVSASYSSNTGSATMTGTSMASPHVTGAVALYLAQNPSATPAQVRSALVSNATGGRISGAGSGSPNLLLYTGFIGGSEPPPQQPVGNPGFENGTAPWTATANVIGTWSQYPARTGTRNAWLNGGGRVQTDTLAQQVTIPAGTATLRFWMRVTTAEYENVVYDRLTLTANGTAVASWSNLDKTSGYAEKTVNLSAYAGQSVALRFTGVEDQSPMRSKMISAATSPVASSVRTRPSRQLRTARTETCAAGSSPAKMATVRDTRSMLARNTWRTPRPSSSRRGPTR